MTGFNGVDYVVIAILLISTLAGLMRGLLHEVIALITWIAACIVAILFASKLAASFSGAEQGTMVSIGLSFIALFLGTLLVGTLINYFVSRTMSMAGIGIFNRFLGGVFGIARGFLMVIVMMFIVQLTPAAAQPYWSQSQFVTSFQPEVVWFSDLVTPGLQDIRTTVSDGMQKMGTQMQETVKQYQPNK